MWRGERERRNLRVGEGELGGVGTRRGRGGRERGGEGEGRRWTEVGGMGGGGGGVGYGGRRRGKKRGWWGSRQ